MLKHACRDGMRAKGDYAMRALHAANLCHTSGGELEELQFLPGHASIHGTLFWTANKIWRIR